VPRDAQRGMTLLELLLVLAIVVVVGALAVPMLRGPLENQRLRKSADLIRAEWNRARVRAMKSGRIQVFRSNNETGEYSLQAWVADTDDQESTNDTIRFGAPASSSGSNPMQDTRTLPEGIVFVGGDASSDSRGAQLQNTFAPPDSTQARPILFYPDGTTSTARLAVSNEKRNYYVVLSLRGLTGIAQASDLVTAQELPP